MSGRRGGVELHGIVDTRWLEGRKFLRQFLNEMRFPRDDNESRLVELADQIERRFPSLTPTVNGVPWTRLPNGERDGKEPDP